MALFTPADRDRAESLFALNEANPFLPERVELERRLLGPDFLEEGSPRAPLRELPRVNPNFGRLLESAEALLQRARTRLDELGTGSVVADDELELYENAAIFTLYHRWYDELSELARAAELAPAGEGPGDEGAAEHGVVDVPWYPRFRDEARDALRPGGRRLPLDLEPAHLLALFFQVARAFRQIHSHILGTSAAAVCLRAAVWQSIFTHDIRRYQRSVYRHMRDLATLVTGPSGTGKELVARAVGLSGYLAFDEKRRRFATSESERFLPLNLTALSPTLIESELFGHKRGAFTGALGDRRGWFEACPAHGTVFLDEIGEISREIQLKLLRVLQTRTFQRLGDTSTRAFRGKLVSATNRDLEEAMAQGRFRDDLYYRICSDRIVTPSLAEQIDGSMDELRVLALFVARGLVGDEAGELADEVVRWVETSLGRGYAWPGNFRELEQCVRSVLVRREYRPRLGGAAGGPGDDARRSLSRAFTDGERSADEILRSYCTLVYAERGSFDGAARVLGLDRRTVKAKVDPELLRRLRGS